VSPSLNKVSIYLSIYLNTARKEQKKIQQCNSGSNIENHAWNKNNRIDLESCHTAIQKNAENKAQGKLGNILVETFVILDVSSNVSLFAHL
jgi:hypothetical protein